MVRNSGTRNRKSARAEKESLYRRFLRRWRGPLHLEQLEDRIAPAMLTNVGPDADHQVYNLPAGGNVAVLRHDSGDNYTIHKDFGAFDDTAMSA